MSKNWGHDKAEFDWIYLDQGKSMIEARGIPNRCHQSHAPARAHRTWKDEGAVQKHKKRRKPSPGKRFIEAAVVAASPSPSSNPRTTIEMLQFNQDIAVPSGPIEASSVLTYIQGSSAAFHALEILLTKWQPDGEYMKLLVIMLQTPDYCEWIPRLAGDGRPLLFSLIEKHVPHDEQLTVGKLLLEAYSSSQHTAVRHDDHYLTAWAAACHCTEWDEANEILYRGNRVATLAGDIFLNCARASIAEQMLSRYIQHFRTLKMHGGWPKESELHDAQSCRQKYLTILEECRDANLALRPSFYRDSLEIIEAQYPFSDSKRQARFVDLADECRHKYLQLTNDSGSPVLRIKSSEEDVGDAEENELMKASRHDTPSSTKEWRSPEIMPSIEAIESPISKSETETASSVGESERSTNSLTEPGITAHNIFPPTPNVAVNTLVSKWMSLQGFSTYVHDLLQEEGSDVSIFGSKLPNVDSLFDTIHMHMPPNQQVSFTKAILVAFSTANVDLCRHPPILSWWLTLFSAPSWKEFQHRLEPQQVDAHLQPAMSPGAAELVLNTTILLVGERLLGELKSEMTANRARKAMGGDLVRYHGTFRQFMDILGELRKRDLNVDGSWLSHILNMM